MRGAGVPPFTPFPPLGSARDLVGRFGLPTFYQHAQTVGQRVNWAWVPADVERAQAIAWSFPTKYVIYSFMGPLGIFHGAVALGEDESP